MTEKNKLATVPNPSMVSLFKALVSFLIAESEVRGWDDVSERLRAVEAALAGRSGKD